jgi:hypothetical protein
MPHRSRCAAAPPRLAAIGFNLMTGSVLRFQIKDSRKLDTPDTPPY